MKIAKYLHTFSLFFTFFLCSCTQQKETNVTLEAYPETFPDYNGTVIPPNIAPLNFMMDDVEEMSAEFQVEGNI
jgi:hypothetical protein